MVGFELRRKKRRLAATTRPPGFGGAAPGAVDSEVEERVARRRMALLEDAGAKTRRLKREGNVLAEAGRFRAAMGRWQEAIATDAGDAALFELMAQASMAVQDDFNAVQFATRATELAPEWSDAFLTLARSHLNFGELSLALDNLDKAIALNGGRATDEMAADRADIVELLHKQELVLQKRDEEAAKVADAGKLQAISCLKHLCLRAKAVEVDADQAD